MTFGAQLREWRRRRFLTQKELAAQLGVTWQTVSRWEGDQGIPYPATQRRLVEALQVDPGEFFEALKSAEERKGKAVA